MLLAWSVVAGICLVSCQKDDVLTPTKPDSHDVQYSQCSGGGEKEGDLLIGQNVLTSNNDPIHGAVSSLWVTGRGTADDTETTDVSGSCSFSDSNMCYYITTIAAGYRNDTTGVFYVSKDTTITVNMQPI